MENVSASIVVPVHNAERYLDRCLSSVAAQTLPDFEVICVDDGSIDASSDILARRASGDPRISVISQDCLGVSAARNAGVRAARGEWVLFADADDCVERDFALRLVSAARQMGSQVAICSFDEFCEGPERHFPRERCPEENLYGRSFSLADMEGVSTSLVTPNVWRMAFRRDFLFTEGIAFPEELATSEDLVFIYRALFAAERICLIPDVLYHYRRDADGSLTRSDRGDAGLRALAMLSDELERWLPGRPWLERHFVNLALDVLEYQLGSCAGWEEFLRLWQGLCERWRPYAALYEAEIAPRYQSFYQATAGKDPGPYLFRLYSAARDDRERLSFDLSQARCERGAFESELAGIKVSHAWRLVEKLWGISARIRRTV